jgi:hypothetical protein
LDISTAPNHLMTSFSRTAMRPLVCASAVMNDAISSVCWWWVKFGGVSSFDVIHM